MEKDEVWSYFFGGNEKVSSISLQNYNQFSFPNRRKQLKTKLVVVVEGYGRNSFISLKTTTKRLPFTSRTTTKLLPFPSRTAIKKKKVLN